MHPGDSQRQASGLRVDPARLVAIAAALTKLGSLVRNASEKRHSLSIHHAIQQPKPLPIVKTTLGLI